MQSMYTACKPYAILVADDDARICRLSRSSHPTACL